MEIVRVRQYFTSTGEPDGKPRIKNLNPHRRSGRFVFNREGRLFQQGVSDVVSNGKGRVVEAGKVTVERTIDGSLSHDVYSGEQIDWKSFTHELAERRTLLFFTRRARRDVIKFVP